jgi:hypothetical protein
MSDAAQHDHDVVSEDPLVAEEGNDEVRRSHAYLLDTSELKNKWNEIWSTNE